MPLIWVGLPIMRSESLSDAALVFNDIDRQYGEAQGAHYVDLWEAFSDENSVYRASGPDVNGIIVRLRAADGVHFNKVGRAQGRAFRRAGPPQIARSRLAAARDAGKPRAGSAHDARAAGRRSPAPSEAAPPAAPEAAAPVAPPPKPLAGKVESLNDSAVSPGGALTTPPRGGAPRHAGRGARAARPRRRFRLAAKMILPREIDWLRPSPPARTPRRRNSIASFAALVELRDCGW